jgi:hypothetical protein
VNSRGSLVSAAEETDRCLSSALPLVEMREKYVNGTASTTDY